MGDHQDIPKIVFSSSPLRKVVHFNETISIPPRSTTSISLLTSSSSTSLSLPLIAEKPGTRFKLVILLLSLLIALIIGFILSLLFVSQLVQLPKQTSLPRRFLSQEHVINSTRHLLEHLQSTWINQLDVNTDTCEDFYGFVCRKWLNHHPLSPLDLKRSWLTERSQDIRERFAENLANLSEIHTYKYQMEMAKNQTEQSTSDVDDFGELTSARNELEQFYSSDDDNTHKLVKRQSNPNDFSEALSNMLLYYHQCLHTSESVLLEELEQLAHDRFWFTNDYEITSTSNHLHFLFEQMIDHPLMRIWNINTIDLGTQIIIHIQRQTFNPDHLFLQHSLEQATLFEHYVRKNQINLCYQSSRVGPLANTLQEYNDLLISSLTHSNASISEDLLSLISNKNSLPIIYSSVRRSSDLKDLIQFMFDKEIIQAVDNTDVSDLFANFTHDLDHSLSHTPIFRSTISRQCQLFLHYYIRFRSLNDSKLEAWYDYISSSIIHLIVHSWPGDASYTCLYSTIVRHHQFERIPYWQTFLQYTKKQIKDASSPVVTVEIRLVDFFQLDSIFRFLFADQFAHYCNLMVYKYGPKLLPFVSVFHEGIQISLKSLWRQTLQKEQISLLSSSNRIPTDCMTLLEYYYPFTLSSFYEQSMSNKTAEVYFIAYKLRDFLFKNSANQSLSMLKFHIKPERLQLFLDLSPVTSPIPYEYYFIEDNYLSTAWNIIESSHEQFVQPMHEFFEINAHHTIEQGIFLQPTVAELYSNETTRLAALLLIGHELGHAFCPCAINQTEREYFADLIALRLIQDYLEQQTNRTMSSNELATFFITYGQSECGHINREMISLIHNKQPDFTDVHLNRVLKGNERFPMIFNCPLNQRRQAKQISSLMLDLCAACRNKSK